MNAVGTMGRSESQAAPLEKAALAIGSALVAWSERRSARAAEPVDFDELMIRRAAEQDAERLLSERHAGANLPLFRIF
ncbi:hypothetical protein GCM10027413_14760 [Conyzicola nivalis]|uniref:Uncharacterized protein n=1 Tax=Conyzicola nivalis TaxID=1477021 RepID=A0A916SFZ8_9MICO|nr:hypothetical protein [Conyzicola nivalis]GGA98975.1 hypothetical protein GCM10010979_11860 [Conyzicola nivalis]